MLELVHDLRRVLLVLLPRLIAFLDDGLVLAQLLVQLLVAYTVELLRQVVSGIAQEVGQIALVIILPFFFVVFFLVAFVSNAKLAHEDLFVAAELDASESGSSLEMFLSAEGLDNILENALLETHSLSVILHG